MASIQPAQSLQNQGNASAKSDSIPTTTRSSRLVAAEVPSSYGSLSVLAAGAPEVVAVAEQDHLAAAALAMKIAVKASVSVKIKIGGKGGKSSKGGGMQSEVAGATSHSTGRNGDPDVAYAFQVIIGSVTYATFSEISGLSWKAEPVQIRQGGNNAYSENLAGPGKFDPLVLKRGWFASTGEFYDMLRNALTGAKLERVNLTIACLDREYKVIGEYQFSRAFIIEYTGPSLNAMSGQVGFEQIRMAYDKFTYTSK